MEQECALFTPAVNLESILERNNDFGWLYGFK